MRRIIIKCDRAWAKKVKEGQVRKIHTDAFGPVDPHHILPKSVYHNFRHDLNNGIALYRSDHTWAENNPEEFLKWLEVNVPEKYQWYLENKDKKALIDLDYEKTYEGLI